jgi:hypothetical protein
MCEVGEKGKNPADEQRGSELALMVQVSLCPEDRSTELLSRVRYIAMPTFICWMILCQQWTSMSGNTSSRTVCEGR